MANEKDNTMDMPNVGAAVDGLKIGIDLLKSLYNRSGGTDDKVKIDDALSKLGDAQDALFTLREELIRLQTENVSLNKQIAESETWDTKLSEYELARTSGGAVVYKSKGKPEHYSCPSCISSKKVIEILQNNRTQTGKYRCVGCKAEFPIEPPRPSPTRHVTEREF